jgi:hypothetical protein
VKGFQTPKYSSNDDDRLDQSLADGNHSRGTGRHITGWTERSECLCAGVNRPMVGSHQKVRMEVQIFLDAIWQKRRNPNDDDH